MAKQKFQLIFRLADFIHKLTNTGLIFKLLTNVFCIYNNI